MTPIADLDLPVDSEDLQLPDLYIGLDIPLLAPGDGIITDRHHASADRYESDDPMNQIEGQISPFTMSGWLRRGCEAIVQQAGATACHPGAADGDYVRADVYDRDLEAGYHEKGSCVEDGEGCIIHDLFGAFGDQPGKLLRHPISFSPIRRHVDVTDGEVEAHYRQLNTHVRSRNDADGGQPLRHATQDVLGNVEGTWRLTLRTPKPAFVGLIMAAVTHLNAHSDEYAHQIGGSRNFGAGVGTVEVLNPLYTDREIRRVYDRAKQPSDEMQRKDSLWAEGCNQQFMQALQARLAADHEDVPELGEWL